jgi:CheY-like chemotaxis protein
MSQWQVLLVESDLEVQDWLAGALQASGCRVATAGAVFGLHGLVRRLQPDTIIVDVHLPYRSGLTFVRRLKSDPRTASIPVILLVSGDALLPDAARTLRILAGAKALEPAALQGPVGARAVLGALQRTIGPQGRPGPLPDAPSPTDAAFAQAS